MEKALIGQQDVLQPQSRLSQLIINLACTARSESLWPGQEVSNWALSARPWRCWETLLLSRTPCPWISADEDIDCVTAGNVDVELSLKGAWEVFIRRPGHTTALLFFFFFCKTSWKLFQMFDVFYVGLFILFWYSILLLFWYILFYCPWLSILTYQILSKKLW